MTRFRKDIEMEHLSKKNVEDITIGDIVHACTSDYCKDKGKCVLKPICPYIEDVAMIPATFLDKSLEELLKVC